MYASVLRDHSVWDCEPTALNVGEETLVKIGGIAGRKLGNSTGKDYIKIVKSEQSFPVCLPTVSKPDSQTDFKQCHLSGCSTSPMGNRRII